MQYKQKKIELDNNKYKAMNYKLNIFNGDCCHPIFTQVQSYSSYDLFKVNENVVGYEVQPYMPINSAYNPRHYEISNMNSITIDDIYSKYCMCDAKIVQTAPFACPMTNYELLSDIHNKRVSITDMCMTTLLQKLMDTIKILPGDFSSFVTFQKKKHDRVKSSNRRSVFIGVSKNGPSWQSMITVNKRKTYIGTYKTEKEAAIAFDFYSMLIHALEGKTNFSYTKGQVWEMINNFVENDQVLNVYQLGF